MQQITKERIDVAFKALPPEKQDAILSLQLNSAITSAMQSAKLDATQTAGAGTLITAALLGLCTQDELASMFVSDLHVPDNAAASLASESFSHIVPLLSSPDALARIVPTTPRPPVPSYDAVLASLRAARTDGGTTLSTYIGKLAERATLPAGDEVAGTLFSVWSALPGPVRNSIIDQEYKQAVRNATNTLVIDAAVRTAIEEEVLFVLLGMVGTDDLTNTLQANTRLSAADAAAVASYVNEHLIALLSPYIGAAQQPGQSAPQTGITGTKSPLEQFMRDQADVGERMGKLPVNVRTTILSDDVAQAFADVVRTFDLDQAKFMAFGKEAVRVLVGLETTKDFRGRMGDGHVVDQGQMDDFVAAVERGMFHPVRGAILQALQNKGGAA